jgi:molybdopterin molybdotransferase
MADLLALDEALARVLERARPLGSERVPLVGAAGRVLAADARSAVDLPPFPSSAMDGYAVRASDTPGTLPVVERIAAGRPAPRPLRPGEAMAIATGGVVPEGADAVVPIEAVVPSDNAVEVAAGVIVGAHLRPRGGDVEVGEVIVPAGTLLGPAQIGALAAAGIATLECRVRPHVTVLTTGTELRPPGEALEPGEIYEANGALLESAASGAGARVERLVSVVDDRHAHREALARGLEADVLITSGGVSVGPHDLVRATAAELGVEEVFWGVAVKPGKPLSFGVRRSTLVFGLPGNPVSTLVGFELFVRPALLALQGHREAGPRFEPGRLAAGVRRNPARDELVRSQLDVDRDAAVLRPLEGQESHMIARAAGANALTLVPRGEGRLEAGSSVRYLRLAGG